MTKRFFRVFFPNSLTIIAQFLLLLLLNGSTLDANASESSESCSASGNRECYVEFVICEDTETESSYECINVVCTLKSENCYVDLGYGAVLGSISSGTLRPDIEIDADGTINVLGKRG